MRRKGLILLGATVAVVCLMMFWNLNFDIIDYIIKKRSVKLLAMLVVAVATAVSTLVFQTIATNRILTPSVLGLDALYVLFNLLMVVVFGAYTQWVHNPYLNFAASGFLMMLFALLFYKVIFRKIKSIYTIVLIGVIMGTFFSSITGMLQILINPDEFSLVMDKLFANFADVKDTLLYLSLGIVAVATGLVYRSRHELDAMSLGKDHALNLGIDYDRRVMGYLMLVFLLVAVATALVGPITFLGFFSVNMSKTVFKTHRHDVLLFGTVCVAVMMLFLGQFFVEHLFNFGIPVSVVINLVGGGYFIRLLLKENKR